MKRASSESRTVATGIKHLYARGGKQGITFFTVFGGTYYGLGKDLDAARAELEALRGKACDSRTVAGMCLSYLRQQRELQQLVADGRVVGRVHKGMKILAARTFSDYEDMLMKRVIPAFGHLRPENFTSAHAAEYLHRRAWGDGVADDSGAATRANRELSALAAAFNWALRHRRAWKIESNPCHGVRRNAELPLDRRVSIEELNAFLTFAKQRSESSAASRLRGGTGSLPQSQYMAALIGACIALTGRRPGELLRLHKSQVMEDGIMVLDSKWRPGLAQRRYVIAWSPALRAVLRDAQAVAREVESVYVFPNRDGQPYTDTGFRSLWSKLMRAWAPSGPNDPRSFRAYDLRSLYVSEMLRQGRDPNTHANTATAKRVYDRRRDIDVTPLDLR